MAATAAQIAELRRLVNEPTSATYTDLLLGDYIERYPVIDARGEEPYTYDLTTAPPSLDPNPNWMPSYDMNSAAADIWDEKAAKLAEDFDFRSEGREFSRSQAYEQAQRRAAYFRSRRAMKTIRQRMEPPPGKSLRSIIANLAEED